MESGFLLLHRKDGDWGDILPNKDTAVEKNSWISNPCASFSPRAQVWFLPGLLHLSISTSSCLFLPFHSLCPLPPTLSFYHRVFIPLYLSLSPPPFTFAWGLSSEPGCGANFLIPASTSNQNFQSLLDKEPHFEAKLGWSLRKPQATSISSSTYLTSTFVALGLSQALI